MKWLLAERSSCLHEEKKAILIFCFLYMYVVSVFISLHSSCKHRSGSKNWCRNEQPAMYYFRLKDSIKV